MPGESTFDIEIVLRANHVLVSKDHRKHVQITLEMVSTYFHLVF